MVLGLAPLGDRNEGLGGAGGTQRGPRTGDISRSPSPHATRSAWARTFPPSPLCRIAQAVLGRLRGGANPGFPDLRRHPARDRLPPQLAPAPRVPHCAVRWFWQRSGTRSRTTALARLSQSWS